MRYRARTTKYRNTKITVDGITFDSQKEYLRYRELKLLEQSGLIFNLKRQQKFNLIPAMYEESNEFYKRGIHKGERKQGKLIEKECSYIADFTYMENGELVVEDTKGFRTKDYVIKRKLMLYVHGIRIREV